jgi:hypothetical protein
VQLFGQWHTAPAARLAQAARSDEGARSAYRAILGEERRRYEAAIEREEIPAEYAEPISRYFTLLTRGQ